MNSTPEFILPIPAATPPSDWRAPRVRKFNCDAACRWFGMSSFFGLIFLVVCLTTFPRTTEVGRVEGMEVGDPTLCYTNRTRDFYCPTVTVTWSISDHKNCSDNFVGELDETSREFFLRMKTSYPLGSTDPWFVSLVGIECMDLTSMMLGVVFGSVSGFISLLLAVCGFLNGWGEARYVKI